MLAQSDTEAAPESREERDAPAIRERDVPAAVPNLRVGSATEPSDEGETSDQGESPAPARLLRPATGGQTPTFTYTVRPGDSLGAIAQMFGLTRSEVARANRLSDDSILQAGQVLHVPNPFAAQVSRLEKTVEELSAQVSGNNNQNQNEQARIKTLTAQVGELEKTNRALQHDVHVMPWWRRFALTTGVAALMMLGVTALAMLEWFMLRRRFLALAGMNESIRRLDQKYRVALSKAELRLQQIYGRRRAQSEDLDKAKLPEQIEIDRLNEQLKDLLEAYLERLGASRTTRRRTRLHDLFFGADSPVEARAGRR